MTPAIAILLLYKHMAAATALFVLAGITDGLDGFVARKSGPADGSRHGFGSAGGQAPARLGGDRPDHPEGVAPLVHIIIVSRDLILIGGSLILYMFLGRWPCPRRGWGKFTTGFQIATVLLAMLDNFAPVLRSAVMPVAFLTTALTIASGLDYVFRGTRLLNDNDPPVPRADARPDFLTTRLAGFGSRAHDDAR